MDAMKPTSDSLTSAAREQLRGWGETDSVAMRALYAHAPQVDVPTSASRAKSTVRARVRAEDVEAVNRVAAAVGMSRADYLEWVLLNVKPKP